MKHQHRKYLIFAILLSVFSSILYNYGISAGVDKASNSESIQIQQVQNNLESSQHEGYENITEFWNIEKNRVETTDPDIWWGETEVKTYSDVNYNMTEISYAVPNWVDAINATFRINATLFGPSNASKSLGKLPGVVAYHGLNSMRLENYGFARDAITVSMLDCIILCPDQPGHGDSEGAEYTPSNWKYDGDFNKTSHNYLAICAGLQAIRVMETLKGVNISQLAVTGNSYGGLTSMWVSSIYNNKISLCMPSIACGGLEYIHDESLIYDVMKSRPGELDDFWQKQGKETDPLYYIGINNFPSVCWFFGTNDDYFAYEALNYTYNAVTGTERKWLQISPNAHHGLFDDVYSKHYLISNEFYSGNDPPEISLIDREDAEGIMFDSYDVKIEVQSDQTIEKVEICYRYKDIFAEPWRWEEMLEVDGTNDQWETRIKTPWITSETEFYFIVHLEDEQSTWFTSQIYTAGVLKNGLSFLPFVIMGIGLFFLVYIILQQRYRDDVEPYTGDLKKKLKMYFIIETTGVFIGETIIFGSLALPWLNLGSISWSHLYLFDHIGTYTDVFSGLAYFSVFLVFSTWVSGAFMALANPLKGGFSNLGWPALIILFTTAGTNFLGMGSLLAIGPVVFLLGGTIQITFGIWQKIYRRRLGVPEKPYFHWLKRSEKLIEQFNESDSTKVLS